MLLLSNKIQDIPVMSIQTGDELARTKEPIIDPRYLTIVAVYVEGAHIDEQPSVLHVGDIRESGSLGFIVDDASKLMPLDGLVRLMEIIDMDFTLIGCKVVDTTGQTLGKVSDYAFEPSHFTIQQLYVGRPLLKSFSNSSLIINRTQVVGVSKGRIVVEAPTVSEKTEATSADAPAFTNPFRNPQPESSLHR